MSYAQAAARGPKQSPEEGLTSLSFSRAPAPPSIEKSESEGTSSLIDVDSPHVSSVPSNFEDQAVKTRTQAERLEHEAEDEMRNAADAAKKRGATKGKHGKSRAKEAGRELRENSDNPVVIGNAVMVAIGAAALGFGAYKKHSEGKLDWETVGLWSGVVGAFAVGDYFASRWLLQNKYPPK